MKRNNIKLSVLRKSINRLSARQRNRVMSEIRNGITVQNYSPSKVTTNIKNNGQRYLYSVNYGLQFFH